MIPVKWIGGHAAITYVRILGVIVIVSFALSGWTVLQQSQAAAERAADKKAANTAQVARCFQQVRDMPDVLRILDLIDTLATNAIEANRMALQVVEGDDPLSEVRRASLRRLVPARRTLRRFIRRASEQIPSVNDCNRLANALDVDPAQLRR